MKRTTGTLEERFWHQVDKRGPDECWPWLGTVWSGYGRLRHNKKNHTASRLALEIVRGTSLGGLFALHRCDNPLCVNPAHLFPGTHTDNMRDCAAKGRNREQRKTHCAHGHEFNDANTYRHGNQRCCRVCNRANVAKSKVRRQARERRAA